MKKFWKGNDPLNDSVLVLVNETNTQTDALETILVTGLVVFNHSPEGQHSLVISVIRHM